EVFTRSCYNVATTSFNLLRMPLNAAPGPSAWQVVMGRRRLLQPLRLVMTFRMWQYRQAPEITFRSTSDWIAMMLLVRWTHSRRELNTESTSQMSMVASSSTMYLLGSTQRLCNHPNIEMPNSERRCPCFPTS